MNIQTYPLPPLSIAEAVGMQFRLVDCITRVMEGHKPLTRGGLGVMPGKNKPEMTRKMGRVIAEFFGVEDCMLVREAGSSVIRLGLHAIASPEDKILVHRAPVYPTTAVSMKPLGLILVEAGYNDLSNVRETLAAHPDVRGALIQYTKQLPGDNCEVEQVAVAIREAARIPIMTDDNYTVMKVKYIGAQCGVDLSCFSSFKLLRSEGIGMIVGRKEPISHLMEENYSDGVQARGHEALGVLRGLTYAPVALAVSADVGEECVRRLQNREVPGMRHALLANAQSKVILVELEQEIAAKVLEGAKKLGTAPYPMGAESKYELTPIFYRISGTFRTADVTLERRMIRINPMRGGADTIIRILKESIERATTCF